MFEDVVRKAHDDAGAAAACPVLRSAKFPNQIQLITTHERQPYGSTARHMCKRNLVIVDESGTTSFKTISNGHPTWFVPSVREASGIREAMAELREAARDPYACMVQACFNEDDKRVAAAFAKDGYTRRVCKEDVEAGKLPCFKTRKAHLHMIDVDLGTDEQKAFCRDQGIDIINNTQASIRTIVARFLPPELQNVTCGYHLSGTAGISFMKSSKDTDPRVVDPTVAKFHLFFWTEQPLAADEIKGWLTDSRCGVDTAVNANVQPHYIGVQFENEAGQVVKDPFEAQRWGIIEGKHDTLSLKIEERETDIFTYADGRAQKTVRRERSYVSGAGSKQRIIPVGTAKRYRGLGWRERLALMKGGDVNVTLLEVTMGLARELYAQHDGSIPEAVKRISIKQIYDAVEAAPGYRSQAGIKEHKRRAWDLFCGALRIVAARADEIERARSVRVAPFYPDTRISLSEAEKKRDEILKRWFDEAAGCDAARIRNEKAREEWIAAGSPVPESKTALPYQIDLRARHPKYILIGDPGLGKTRRALKMFLTSGAHLTHRLFWYVPFHDKAKELKETFLEIAKELGIEQPNCVVFEGFDRLCQADHLRKRMASEAAAFGISPKNTACVGCKLRKTCEWLRMEDEIGPGLKIGVHDHIGTATPTLSLSRTTAGDAPEGGKDEEQKDVALKDEVKTDEPDPAPILGYVIDESYEEKLDHEATLGRDDVPTTKALRGANAGLKNTFVLTDILAAAKAAFDTVGPVAFEPFVKAGAFVSTMNPDFPGQRRIDALCDRIYRLAKNRRREATKIIRKKMMSRRCADVPNLMKEARSLSELYDFFWALRTTYRLGNTHTDALRATEIDGKRIIEMGWRRRLPHYLRDSAVLFMDASATENNSLQPFAERDPYCGSDVIVGVQVFKIRVHAPGQKIIKALDARIGKRRVEDTIYEEVTTAGVGEPGEERADEAAEGETPARDPSRAKKKRKLVRARIDSQVEKVLRVAQAICGRVIAGGGKAGVITHKVLEGYIRKFNLLPGVKVGHLGAIRGMNSWEDVDVLLVIGCKLPDIEQLQKIAARIYALDPDGRRVQFGAGEVDEVVGVRVQDADGQTFGIPCYARLPRCPLVREVREQIVSAEELQAIGRGRGIRRDVLVISLNNEVVDLNYDAVVTADALLNISQVGAILYAHARVPRRTRDLKSLAPHAFFGRKNERARKINADLWGRGWGRALPMGQNTRKRPIAPVGGGGVLHIGLSDVLTDFVPEHSDGFRFTRRTVLWGDPGAHAFLNPPHPQLAAYNDGGRVLPCLVDQTRPEAAAATLERILSANTPHTAKRGRPPKRELSAEGLRKREYREKLKAAKVTGKTKKENSNEPDRRRVGDQDPAKSASKEPKSNDAAGTRTPATKGARPAARKAGPATTRTPQPECSVSARAPGAFEGES